MADPARTPILVANAGLSSLKLRLFRAAGETRFAGSVAEIGGAPRLAADGVTQARPIADHAAALATLLERAAADGVGLESVGAAAHRVVHGGAELTRSTVITPDFRVRIEAAAELAPFHNPPALAVIDALAAMRPALPQIAGSIPRFMPAIPKSRCATPCRTCRKRAVSGATDFTGYPMPA